MNKFKLATFVALITGSAFLNFMAFEIVSPKNAIDGDGSLNFGVLAIAVLLFVWSLIGFGVAIYELGRGEGK